MVADPPLANSTTDTDIHPINDIRHLIVNFEKEFYGLKFGERAEVDSTLSPSLRKFRERSEFLEIPSSLTLSPDFILIVYYDQPHSWLHRQIKEDHHSVN